MNAKAIYIGYSEFRFHVRKVYGLVGLIFFKIIYFTCNIMIQFGKYKIKFDSVKINASYSKQVVQVQDLLKHVSKDSGVC